MAKCNQLTALSFKGLISVKETSSTRPKPPMPSVAITSMSSSRTAPNSSLSALIGDEGGCGVCPRRLQQIIAHWALNVDQRRRSLRSQKAELLLLLLARDAFIERIVALLPWCSSVCLSVRPSVWDACLHCDHTVHFSADLSSRLDSPMFWVPWHQSVSTYSQPSFPVPPGTEVGYGCAN